MFLFPHEERDCNPKGTGDDSHQRYREAERRQGTGAMERVVLRRVDAIEGLSLWSCGSPPPCDVFSSVPLPRLDGPIMAFQTLPFRKPLDIVRESLESWARKP